MALARALAVQPEVLLLDEPFGALDAQVRKELRSWLRRLHDEVHVTTVFVTHDQEEALEVADEIVIINRGRLEQAGSPADLYERPANEFVMSFLGPVTRLGGALVRPHDISLSCVPDWSGVTDPGTIAGKVTRVTRLGFEVRVDVLTDAGEEVVVQVTRAQADSLNVAAGTRCFLRGIVDSPVVGRERLRQERQDAPVTSAPAT
jgi:sulfate transport system ATP-binding protein